MITVKFNSKEDLKHFVSEAMIMNPVIENTTLKVDIPFNLIAGGLKALKITNYTIS